MARPLGSLPQGLLSLSGFSAVKMTALTPYASAEFCVASFRKRKCGTTAERPRMKPAREQRRLAGAGDARHAHQPMQRNVGGDVLQVVLRGAAHAEAYRAEQRIASEVVGKLHPRAPHLDVGRSGVGAAPSRQVVRGQRVRALQGLGRSEEHDAPAVLAGSGPHVEELVGLEHDLRVVLDHDERIARIAQLLQTYCQQFGRPCTEGLLIPVHLSRNEMAALVGARIETVIRIMSRWHKETLVRSVPEGFLVADPETLQNLIANGG